MEYIKMNLFGLTLLLYFLKLSIGSGFWDDLMVSANEYDIWFTISEILHVSGISRKYVIPFIKLLVRDSRKFKSANKNTNL